MGNYSAETSIQTSKIKPQMMIKIFTCLLLAASLQQIAAQEGSGLPPGICECINPWEAQEMYEHMGDPEKTCPNFCYVDCNSDCYDRAMAKGKGRCWSKVACM